MYPTFKEHLKTKFLVMVDGANVPRVRHESYGEAKKEAIRLATVTGKNTFVLQILKKYKLQTEVMETSYKNVI